MSPEAEFVLRCLMDRQRNRRVVYIDVLMAEQRRRLIRGMKELASSGFGRFRKGRGLEFSEASLLENLERVTRPGFVPTPAAATDSNGGIAAAADGEPEDRVGSGSPRMAM